MIPSFLPRPPILSRRRRYHRRLAAEFRAAGLHDLAGHIEQASPPHRFPLRIVRASTLDRQEQIRLEQAAKIRRQERALAQLGHARDQAYRDAAKLVSDLRVFSDQSRLLRHGDQAGTIEFACRIDPALAFYAFRNTGSLRPVLAELVEEALHREPDVRQALYTARP